jgi:hypothetical protein
MEQVANEYFMYLWKAFQYDIGVFTNVWMYIPFLIPIFFYLVFFTLKWWLLTLPLTIPLNFILKIFGHRTYWPFKFALEKYKNKIINDRRKIKDLENEIEKLKTKELRKTGNDHWA